jgi:hypothetical protein
MKAVEAATECSFEEQETLLLDNVQFLRNKVAFENQVPLRVGPRIEAFECKLQESIMLEASTRDCKLSQSQLFQKDY